jgi:hypothetical protein
VRYCNRAQVLSASIWRWLRRTQEAPPRRLRTGRRRVGRPAPATRANRAARFSSRAAGPPMIECCVTGLLAWWGGQPGQVGNEAATAVFHQCRGSGSSPLHSLLCVCPGAPASRHLFPVFHLPGSRHVDVARIGALWLSFCARPFAPGSFSIGPLAKYNRASAVAAAGFDIECSGPVSRNPVFSHPPLRRPAEPALRRCVADTISR